ncbi:hypothetical protein [Streptomyces sp. NPDC047981]|uniref:hypothetical protein n=1 Tax=Streptomyces sp. NPDC047981 TaxID=3154610 RepID=UPI00344A9535
MTTPPTATVRLDHSACKHPRTKAGRAACRKARAAGEVGLAVVAEKPTAAKKAAAKPAAAKKSPVKAETPAPAEGDDA